MRCAASDGIVLMSAVRTDRAISSRSDADIDVTRPACTRVRYRDRATFAVTSITVNASLLSCIGTSQNSPLRRDKTRSKPSRSVRRRREHRSRPLERHVPYLLSHILDPLLCALLGVRARVAFVALT